MNKKQTLLGLAIAVGLGITSAARGALLARDLDGNASTAEAYYDNVLDITWLANANAGAGSNFDDGPSTLDGRMTWQNAINWASGLNISGIRGWRLPNTVDVGNDGATVPSPWQGVDARYNMTTHSEMSYLYYVTLGNKAPFDTLGNVQTDSGLINTGPFSNIQSFFYFSRTDYAPNASEAWFFSFGSGLQGNAGRSTDLYAWAVHDGDVAAVPLPAAVWLLGSALAGLMIHRRKLA